MAKNEQNRRMQDLASRWLNGSLSEVEQQEFDEWFSTPAETPIFIEEDIAPSKEMHRRKLLKKVYKKAKIRHRYKRIPVYGAVAAIFLAVLGGIYVIYDKTGTKMEDLHFVELEDVGPGTNKAALTLANGTIVDLSSDQEGIVVGQEITYTDGRPVLDTKNNNEIYEKSHDTSSLMILNIPKGGQYRVVLSDGSKVWLNAASSLKYPAVFSPNERIVELEGEGYFEVAEDSKRPFKVLCEDQEINVLGTVFNVLAYPEEKEVKTTLISGSLNVSVQQSSVMLKPQEESVWTNNRLYTQTADIKQATGWKDGLFRFSNTELKTAMMELSRWYNLDIEYRGVVPTTYFSGEIERSLHLSSVLDILKESGLNFKLEARSKTNTLVIMP